MLVFMKNVALGFDFPLTSAIIRPALFHRYLRGMKIVS